MEESPRSESDLSWRGSAVGKQSAKARRERTWRPFKLRSYLADDLRGGVLLGDKQLFPDPASPQAAVGQRGRRGRALVLVLVQRHTGNQAKEHHRS